LRTRASDAEVTEASPVISTRPALVSTPPAPRLIDPVPLIATVPSLRRGPASALLFAPLAVSVVAEGTVVIPGPKIVPPVQDRAPPSERADAPPRAPPLMVNPPLSADACAASPRVSVPPDTVNGLRASRLDTVTVPALKTTPQAAAPSGVRVPFDLELPYDEASRIATRDYAGKTYRVNGNPLTLSSLRIAPAANGRVLIEAMIDYRGGRLRNYRGLIFLEGTPRFDAATQTIVIPDLDYSLDPKRRGLFARIAERAAHDSIRARLRESARFALAPRITEARAEITRALTRQLAPGVSLRGRADAIEPQAVLALPAAISVRVVMTGAAEVTITPR